MANILVVDDEEYVRTAIKRNLEKEGHSVTEASDGEEGISMILKKYFEIIIFDVIMPKKGGLEMLMDLKNRCNHSKLIIISGNIPSESKAFFTFVEAFKVKKILHKPHKKEELINAVNELLQEKIDC
jgi:CheY-like chemotaxis protein